jgi:hypothetical protein
MKRMGLIITSLVLVLTGVPTSVFASDPTVAAGPPGLAISEVFVSKKGKEKYIELFLGDDYKPGKYFLLTTTKNAAGAISTSYETKYGFELNEQEPENYKVFDGYDKLNNPTNSRIVWICPETSTNAACAAGGYIDMFEYMAMESEEKSYSRDFGAGGFPIKVSNKTPGEPNNFDVDDGTGSSGGGEGNGTEPDLASQYCEYLRLSEISVYEQWMEVYNISQNTVLAENLDGCEIVIPNLDSPKKPYVQYPLGSLEKVEPYGYAVVYFNFAKSFTKPLEKEQGRQVYIQDDKNYYSEAAYFPHSYSDRTWANFADGWKYTYNRTPGAENAYQQYQICETGKHINEATGNCVKDPDPPAECAEGQFRNPATGRCKKIASDTGLSECAEGQFRNPATNRCKKIASDDDLVPCAEGYERNPDTNRCRKLPVGEDARFGVGPTDPGGGNDMWIWAGIGGAAFVTGLIGWQFRPEIGRALRRAMDVVKRPRGGA